MIFTRVGRELKHSRTTLLGIFPVKGLVLAHSRPFEDERNPTCRKSMVRRCVLSTGFKFTFIVKDWQVPSIVLFAEGSTRERNKNGEEEITVVPANRLKKPVVGNER